MKNSLRLMMILALSSMAAPAFANSSIYGAFGFTEGGFALGVDYEYTGMGDYGVGGYVRIYQKDDDTSGGTSAGLTTVGAFIRPHFNKKKWDMYVSPGLAIIQIDGVSNPPGDSTTLGPSMALGLLYEMTGSVALGVESMSTWVWFDEDYRGQVMEDLMLRFRMSF
ncbi:MAG: hypothetical protein AB7N80_02015 [Bdellovibrionales bacterium]